MKAADRTNITNLTAHSWLVSVAFLLCGWNVGTAANRKCAGGARISASITSVSQAICDTSVI